MTSEYTYRRPDFNYVRTKLETLKQELYGFHVKIDEIERNKYYEDKSYLDKTKVVTGQQVRVGLTAELLENIKAAILAQRPIVRFKPLRNHKDAEANASKREHFWQDVMNRRLGGHNLPNYIAELCDGQLLGAGIYKAAKSLIRWDPKQLKKRRKESSQEHVDRVRGLKKRWGHVIGVQVCHPLVAFFRTGRGGEIEELIEWSYKSKLSVYEQYNLSDTQVNAAAAAGMTGMPTQWVRPVASGVNLTDYVEVFEYWNAECYQIYVNATLVYEECVAKDGKRPSVSYFFAPGKASSSRDPDKWGISVAENLRINEPQINRQLTLMLEASELVTNKKLTLEVPESYTPEVEDDGAGGNRTKTFTFRDDSADPMPPGAKIVDPYEGVEKVYDAMPLVQLLIQIANAHGISPLFKGISPGAAGSGYRDNSLYMMARSMFDYIIDSLEGCLTAELEWEEWCLTEHVDDECWSGEYSLDTSDIEDWPCEIIVELKPSLPQNLIAEGQFWEGQRQSGNVSRSYVRERLGIEQPDEMQDEIDMEQLQELIKPRVLQDAMMAVFGPSPEQQQAQAESGSGLVGPDGKPIQSGAASGLTMPGAGQNGGGRGEMLQRGAGFATGGQPKAPTTQPGVGMENQ